MTVDLRRFGYALEPLLRQRRWQLEALEARLARAAAEIREAESALADLRGRLEKERASAARTLAASLEPARHLRTLRFLAWLEGMVRDAERALAELRARRAELAAEHLGATRRVEALERHREECVADFVREEERRVASEADRDWLSRMRWADPGGEPGRAEGAR